MRNVWTELRWPRNELASGSVVYFNIAHFDICYILLWCPYLSAGGLMALNFCCISPWQTSIDKFNSQSVTSYTEWRATHTHHWTTSPFCELFRGWVVGWNLLLFRYICSSVHWTVMKSFDGPFLLVFFGLNWIIQYYFASKSSPKELYSHCRLKSHSLRSSCSANDIAVFALVY